NYFGRHKLAFLFRGDNGGEVFTRSLLRVEFSVRTIGSLAEVWRCVGGVNSFTSKCEIFCHQPGSKTWSIIVCRWRGRNWTRYGTVGCNLPGLGSRGRHDIIERLMAQSQILAKAERFSCCYGIDTQRHVVDDLDCLTATRISGMHNL